MNDDTVQEEVELPNLWDVISSDGFNYNDYAENEQSIIKPRLEEKGYSSIIFAMGEQDSFGPLTRIVQCIDSEGNDCQFFYG